MRGQRTAAFLDRAERDGTHGLQHRTDGYVRLIVRGVAVQECTDRAWVTARRLLAVDAPEQTPDERSAASQRRSMMRAPEP